MEKMYQHPITKRWLEAKTGSPEQITAGDDMTEALDELNWVVNQICNAIETKAVRIDTDQDETWANVYGRARRAVGR